MNGWKILTGMALVVLFPIMSFAGAGTGKGCDGDKRGGMGGKHFEKMAQALSLTAEQKAQIEAVRAGENEKIAPLRQQMRETREELRQISQAVPFDEAAVGALATRQAETQAQLLVAQARLHSQITAILTPEQRELRDTLRQQKKGEHRRHMKQGA
jgi:protein CpxP